MWCGEGGVWYAVSDVVRRGDEWLRGRDRDACCWMMISLALGTWRVAMLGVGTFPRCFSPQSVVLSFSSGSVADRLQWVSGQKGGSLA